MARQMAAVKKSTQEAATERSAKKVANFKKLASKRVTKVLNGLTGIANLSNRNSYTYDTAQVQKIMHALETAVTSVGKSFDAALAGKPSSTGFEL